MTPRINVAAMFAVAVGAALAVATLLGIPDRLAAAIVAERLETATHHRLRIAGDVAVTLWPSPSFSARNVAFADGADPLKALRVEAQGLRLSIAWQNLLTATPRLSDVELSRVVVRMPLARRRGAAAAGTGPAWLSVVSWLAGGSFEHFVVADGAMTLFDTSSGAISVLDHLDIAFSPALPGHPFNFDGEAVWNGQRVSLAARSTSEAPDAGPNEALPLDFLLEAPGLIAPLSGVARARFADGTLSVGELKGLVGPSRFTGRLDIDLIEAKPMIRAAFAAERVDLAVPFDRAPARVHEAAARPPAAMPVAGLWSDRDFRLERLNYVDADLALDLQHFGFGAFALAGISLRARLQDGRAQLKATAPSGAAPSGPASVLDVELAIDAAGAWPSYRLYAIAQAASLLPLLRQVTGSGALDGQAALTLDVAAEGGNLRAVMASLEGGAGMELRDGHLDVGGVSPGLQPLAARLVSEQAGGARRLVGIDRLAARFRLGHGIAATEDLHLSSPLLDLEGRGSIDLPTGWVDLRLDPRATRRIETPAAAAEAAAFAQPFAIKGPWRAPAVGADLDDGLPAASPENRLDRPAPSALGTRLPAPPLPVDRPDRPGPRQRGGLRLIGLSLAASAR